VAIVHDGRDPLGTARVDAHLHLTVGGAAETLSWAWEGEVGADSSVHVGRIEWPLGNATGDVDLELVLSADGSAADNRYAARVTEA
jgi:hypothetical protein